MKSTGIFIIALIGLSLLVSGAMIVTAMMKPEWFVPAGKTVQADSVHTQAKKVGAPADSAHALPGEHAAASTADTAHASEPPPASPIASKHVEAKQSGPDTAAVPAPVLSPTVSKAEDLQSLVKLYEAMKPQNAAKILGKMQDRDVRTIILHVKKKQAALILSYFDANRAAQILAQ